MTFINAIEKLWTGKLKFLGDLSNFKPKMPRGSEKPKQIDRHRLEMVKTLKSLSQFPSLKSGAALPISNPQSLHLSFSVHHGFSGHNLSYNSDSYSLSSSTAPCPPFYSLSSRTCLNSTSSSSSLLVGSNSASSSSISLSYGL